jgi:hypothetical protein
VIPVAPIAVNTEIGRVAETVERILARRETRKYNAWADLRDDLEATVKLVGETNQLYTRVLRRAKSQRRGGRDDFEDIAQELRDFLEDDTLLEKLTNLQQVIAVASQEHKYIRGPRRKAIASDLRGLERAVNAYIEHLTAIRNGELPHDSQDVPLWNMSSVLAALEAGELPEGLSIQELCEEAIRNRRTDLALSISGLAGSAKQHIRGKWL